jgi:phosphoribosylformimino-5-aminoimidazole carboxamide ribotide isomerase
VFDILAAIDIRGRRVVRLLRGDFDRETIYGDPLDVVGAFVDAGVEWLHVVDLDAARDSSATNRDAIGELLSMYAAVARIEVAGGIRDERTAFEILDPGAARVVLGTAALSDPPVVQRLVLARGAAAVAVALDVRNGHAYGHGWGAEGLGPPVEHAIRALTAVGVETFEVTAIERDGSLEGPDLELLGRAVEVAGSARVIASGGIRSIEDLEAVARIGCGGAILGRALYERRLDLRSALDFAATFRTSSAATGAAPTVLKTTSTDSSEGATPSA